MCLNNFVFLLFMWFIFLSFYPVIWADYRKYLRSSLAVLCMYIAGNYARKLSKHAVVLTSSVGEFVNESFFGYVFVTGETAFTERMRRSVHRRLVDNIGRRDCTNNRFLSLQICDMSYCGLDARWWFCRSSPSLAVEWWRGACINLLLHCPTCQQLLRARLRRSAMPHGDVQIALSMGRYRCRRVTAWHSDQGLAAKDGQCCEIVLSRIIKMIRNQRCRGPPDADIVWQCMWCVYVRARASFAVVAVVGLGLYGNVVNHCATFVCRIQRLLCSCLVSPQSFLCVVHTHAAQLCDFNLSNIIRFRVCYTTKCSVFLLRFCDVQWCVF